MPEGSPQAAFNLGVVVRDRADLQGAEQAFVRAQDR